MKNMKTLGAAILLVVSPAIWAQSTDEQSGQADPSETPMGGPGQMMSPEMRQQMMQHGWGRRMMDPQTMGQWMPHQQMPHMPMTSFSPMYPMMHPMPGMGPGYGMPMMGGMGYGMGNPKLLEQRQQHMTEMRQTLKNIELLLQQILEQQKSL